MRAVDLERAWDLILDKMWLVQLGFTPIRGGRLSAKLSQVLEEPFVCEHTGKFKSWAVNIYCCLLALFALWSNVPPGVLELNVWLLSFSSLQKHRKLNSVCWYSLLERGCKWFNCNKLCWQLQTRASNLIGISKQSPWPPALWLGEHMECVFYMFGMGGKR